METAIDYENLTTGIVNLNLSASGEPSQSNNYSTPSGFIAELYLGPRSERQSSLNSNWHIHYRE